MTVRSIDHLVLTVADIEATVAFYCEYLGMERVNFGEGRVALGFGDQKINLHQHGREFEPKAMRPCPGSADLCFVTDQPVEKFSDSVRAGGVDILEGPVHRTGTRGPIVSIYFRDPDGNLIEVSNYQQPA